MRTQETMYKDKTSLIIYMTKEESEDSDIKYKINEYRKQYDYVTAFISGDRDAKEVLKQIIRNHI